MSALAALTGCSGEPFKTGDACDTNPAACAASAGSGGSVAVAGANALGGSASAGASAVGGTSAAGAAQAFAGGGSSAASSGGTDTGGSPAAGSGGADVGGAAGSAALGGTGGAIGIPMSGAGMGGTGGAPTAPTGVELDRHDWRVSASNTYFPETKAEYAVDADPQSCWASGTPQAPGMWFLLDLHEPHYFFQVEVGVISGSADYGRHVTLSTSTDGNKFTPIRSGIAGMQDLKLDFKEAKYARYLKLELTDDAGGLWWRIDDLHVRQ